MSMLDKVEISSRMCPIFFLIDTSGSMSGAPIGAVNAALEGILPELSALNCPEIEVKIGIITFETSTKWETGPTLVSPEDYSWHDLYTGGATSMGKAFSELNNALSISHGLMKRASGSVAPVLFLLSDGEPTDDYASALESLKNNNWYKVAVRVAIGYGENCNDDVLEEFTGAAETVKHTSDVVELKNLIRFVTITSAQIASNTKQVDAEGLADENPDDNTGKLAAAIQSTPDMLSGDVNPGEEW